LPAASLARIVTVFDPTSNGTVALHCMVVVPIPDAAVPAPPVLVDHVTEVTPTLSLATPLKTIDAADVETDVEEGDVMVSAGGVVFDVEVGAVGVVGVGAGVGVGTVGVVGVGAGVGVGTGVGVVGIGAGVGVAANCVRVIAPDCETSVTPSVAVTSIVFAPIASGQFATAHAPPPLCAVPAVTNVP
jgi:hypothetical protein